MSKFDDKLELYSAEMKKLGIKADPDLLRACTKACGPSIYNADAETVSSSDKSELDRVKNNFLIGKLGLPKSDDLDKMIADTIELMGRSNRNKYRAIFYTILADKAGKRP
jgi:hypothetical protein